MTVYLNIIQIIVSVALIVLTVMQSKGGGLGQVFGGDGSFYSTRRGIEKTVHTVTIVLAILFFVTSLVSVLLG